MNQFPMVAIRRTLDSMETDSRYLRQNFRGEPHCNGMSLLGMAITHQKFDWCQLLIDYGCGVWNPIISADGDGAPVYLRQTHVQDWEKSWERPQIKSLVFGVEIERVTRPNWNGDDWSIDMPTDGS